MSPVMRKQVFIVFDQVRHKLDCAATEDDQRLYISDLYLTTRPTSPIEFSLYFLKVSRIFKQNFREVGKINETGIRSKFIQINQFIKVP